MDHADKRQAAGPAAKYLQAHPSLVVCAILSSNRPNEGMSERINEGVNERMSEAVGDRLISWQGSRDKMHIGTLRT